MRDAVGGSLLLNVVVIFVSVIILFFAGIMAYSKAYKSKNRIIEVIERYGKYDSDVADILNGDLRTFGYRSATPTQIRQKCGTNNENTYAYFYCVYYDEDSAKEGYSYNVVTYIHFDFPLIGGLLEIPVRGETKILGKNYNY